MGSTEMPRSGRPSFARRVVRSPISWVLAVVLVVGLGVGLALFQPWRLFTNTTVDEAVPAVVAPTGAPEPRVLARGEFVSHEHGTSGTASILRLPDGGRVLRLTDLDTSDGPALRVWLTDAPVRTGKAGWFVFDDGKHTDLGSLKGNRGNQNYAIPAEVELSEYTSVSIWCERFRVSFGAAELRPES
ncbi:DM13 domain-containing protein [Nocardia sp. CDC159]|uniref:DM13 domain-containing protein n=1 Tax=Nocardia pulmonis TaxID=2951408 RepID=A0A9X2IYW8_9NOCA|nr:MULTISPECIES: DM13 domain-containing protein [Nocardia]MCM6775375.1 DM13 domain-containing protein [Nocardia pulmonis]MCM6787891.1 DM13 domain-containing protein [Nocardia sp. CDC159]